jgi:hypothetical protein
MYMQGCVALSIHVTHYDAWLGFPYYNMTTPTTEKAPPYPPHGKRTEKLRGFEPCEPSPVPIYIIYYWYVPFVVIWSFPHSWLITGFVTNSNTTRATRRAGTAYLLWIHECIPGFSEGSCCSIRPTVTGFDSFADNSSRKYHPTSSQCFPEVLSYQ